MQHGNTQYNTATNAQQMNAMVSKLEQMQKNNKSQRSMPPTSISHQSPQKYGNSHSNLVLGATMKNSS
jgi:hypothetical protein